MENCWKTVGWRYVRKLLETVGKLLETVGNGNPFGNCWKTVGKLLEIEILSKTVGKLLGKFFFFGDVVENCWETMEKSWKSAGGEEGRGNRTLPIEGEPLKEEGRGGGQGVGGGGGGGEAVSRSLPIKGERLEEGGRGGGRRRKNLQSF